MPLNAEGSYHSSFARLPSAMPLATARDYESYLARLRAFPAYGRQQMENMREGLRTGFVQPRVILEGFEGTITPHIVDAPEKSVFWKPFAAFPVRRPGGGSRAAPRRGPRRDRARDRPRLPGAPRLHDEGVPAEGPDHDRGLRASPGARVLRASRPRLHDPRRHARGGPPQGPGRGRAHAGGDGGGARRAEVGQGASPRSWSSCARTRASTRRRPRSCCRSPRTSPSGWTASCPRSSRRCPASPTGSCPCPRTSPPSTPPAATTARPSAGRARASTGSTRTRWRHGPSTRSRR